METPSEAENFENSIHARALNLVNILNGLTPYERTLVLQEAQTLRGESAGSGKSLDEMERFARLVEPKE